MRRIYFLRHQDCIHYLDGVFFAYVYGCVIGHILLPLSLKRADHRVTAAYDLNPTLTIMDMRSAMEQIMTEWYNVVLEVLWNDSTLSMQRF